ncbi:SGNH/GDSL hydrolase family protein [Streptomyces sp. NBC_01142]|uniref:SGNH/GDSL hydrolase family protein n=1 Tax=Streptomyces sp. NBC_01142 TaxID=2975865 RepID=UPI002254C6ED|nr:SGNH/GDSL hydrolase family protein [Streptomyces sp. NBC_01142]MCX4820477.1 SGNH/GDSL hydrolase family protein [Streptomyces sp. NBC_01142]
MSRPKLRTHPLRTVAAVAASIGMVLTAGAAYATPAPTNSTLPAGAPHRATTLVSSHVGTSPTEASPAETSPVVTWAASPQLLGTAAQERTYRLVVRTSVGGSGLRIRLSNAFGDRPVTFGRAHAGLRKTGATLVPGTNHPLSFGGSPSVTVAPGGSVSSDPLPGTVPPQSDLAVSLYVQSAAGPATGHRMALQTSYVAPVGDHSADDSATAFTQRATSWFYLDAAVVNALRGTGAVAALGDSITDGSASTLDTNRRWPDFLARRLQDDPRSRIKGVANEGISGNKVLSDGSGQSALKRLDRDVLSQRGLRTVFLLEGVNDIKATPAPTAADLIAGYRQIIARSHAAGLCVVGATVMPYRGWRGWTESGEAVRQRVNSFIRDSGAFDAVVDFDAAVKDPAAAARLLPAYDSGDHLHPNDAGMRRMGATVDPGLLHCSRR